MKKTAMLFFLAGVTLLALHSPYLHDLHDKEPRLITHALDQFGSSVGWYIRGGIATLGVIIWMFARTSE